MLRRCRLSVDQVPAIPTTGRVNTKLPVDP
jgi:hypothetical protein